MAEFLFSMPCYAIVRADLFTAGDLENSLAVFETDGQHLFPLFTDEDLAERFCAGDSEVRPTEITNSPDLLVIVVLAECRGATHVAIDWEPQRQKTLGVEPLSSFRRNVARMARPEEAQDGTPE